jgi:uncharacterized phage protein gp47/JayE
VRILADEFVLPDFLQNGTDVDSIHARMLELLPDDIDKTEGGFPWDFTRPTALIAAELLQFYIPEVIKLMFPQWSSGQYLDYLAAVAQTARKAATYATAVLEIKGDPGVTIGQGEVFATEAANGVPSIEFATLESVEIGETGTVQVTVQALSPGTDSNVNPGTIVLMSQPINGITSVTNIDPASGGTEEESDDDLRERIEEINKDLDVSYVGNNADYKRWAEEVAGIGTAIVIPEWNGPETVKIVCLDANGVAANDTLLAAVYNHIMSPDSPIDRLAPPNTILTVAKPELVQITYSFTPQLETGYDIETVVASFRKSLETYYKTASTDGVVKYIQAHSLLANTPGIKDFANFLMNGSTENIEIQTDQYPSTEDVEIDGDVSSVAEDAQGGDD